MAGWPFFVLYLIFAALQQLVRTCRGATSEKTTPTKGDRGFLERWCGGCVTPAARSHLRTLDGWNWTPVFDWVCIWGVGLVALTVVISKFTVLAMSIVVSAFEESTVWVATAVLFGVGLFLFLLPPVPGAPIYLAAGFMLVAVGKKNGWTVMASCLYPRPRRTHPSPRNIHVVAATSPRPASRGCPRHLARAPRYTCAFSLAIKLCACTLQQKLIGETLSSSLWIRKTCGVNTSLVRMMRLILAEPGLSIAKVTILVGGPDWPTSVLCGILKVPLAPVLVGTSPIITLIVPTVAAGAFLAIDESYATVMSVIFASIAATVQSGAIVVAAIYMDKARACD